MLRLRDTLGAVFVTFLGQRTPFFPVENPLQNCSPLKSQCFSRPDGILARDRSAISRADNPSPGLGRYEPAPTVDAYVAAYAAGGRHRGYGARRASGPGARATARRCADRAAERTSRPIAHGPDARSSRRAGKRTPHTDGKQTLHRTIWMNATTGSSRRERFRLRSEVPESRVARGTLLRDGGTFTGMPFVRVSTR